MSLTLHMSSMPSIPTSNCQISMVSQKDEGTGNSRSFDDSKSSLSYLQFALPSPSWAISNRAATATKPIEPTSLPMCKPWPQRLYTSTARSLNSSRSFAVSPSIPPPSFHTGSGSAEKVIDLSEDDISDFGFTLQKPEQEQECFADSDPRTVSLGNHTKIQRRSTGLRGQRDSTDPVCGVPSHTVDSSPSSAIRTGNARLHSLSVSEVIELEGWADLKDAIPEGSEVFCLEDVYHEDPRPKGIRRSVKTTKIDLRNPSIVAPLSKCKSFTHKNMVLRPTKTVELRDGSFIRIQHVILNTLTQDVTLRGHRLQRARHLNGLLESKVNEVILFLEVDLNDPRPELEQGAIEVPINDVVKVRHARFTNRKFPDCRAIFMGDFHNNIDAAERGGLTIRWKYTCRYASATDRYHNVYRERTLERIKPDECLSMYALADDTRRSLWRGETIRGGSFQPMTDGKQLHVLLSQEDLLREEVILTAKRKYSDGSDGLELKTQLAPKRVRCKEQGQLEETKHLFSGAQFGQEMLPKRTIIDLSCDDIDTNAVLLSSNTQEHRSPPSLQHQPNTSFPSNSLSSIPKIIDPISSDLSTPPPSGSLYFTPPTPPPAIHRTANQALTYGDAFCGAGGSTRGALLAGLRPKWGFDFNTHACSSWRANFPFATCYNTDAHTFISRASLPQHRAGFKVDILHLSPPCQYFSPAHTVDGVDDEQNVASLFAVEEVIKVSRARVVTLEQTFGIVCARFRWFFNSLIQMFTSQDFSVRWAVVPLAQWVCTCSLKFLSMKS